LVHVRGALRAWVLLAEHHGEHGVNRQFRIDRQHSRALRQGIQDVQAREKTPQSCACLPDGLIALAQRC